MQLASAPLIKHSTMLVHKLIFGHGKKVLTVLGLGFYRMEVKYLQMITSRLLDNRAMHQVILI